MAPSVWPPGATFREGGSRVRNTAARSARCTHPGAPTSYTVLIRTHEAAPCAAQGVTYLPSQHPGAGLTTLQNAPASPPQPPAPFLPSRFLLANASKCGCILTPFGAQRASQFPPFTGSWGSFILCHGELPVLCSALCRQILSAGYWVLGAGCLALGAGCWALGAGCRVLGAGCRVLGTGYWVLGAGCWLEHPYFHT